MKCHEMSWNVMKCHEMSWNVMKCNEIVKRTWSRSSDPRRSTNSLRSSFPIVSLPRSSPSKRFRAMLRWSWWTFFWFRAWSMKTSGSSPCFASFGHWSFGPKLGWESCDLVVQCRWNLRIFLNLPEVMSMFENRLATRGNMVLVYWSTILQSVMSILVVNHSLVEASGAATMTVTIWPTSSIFHPSSVSQACHPSVPRRARCFTLAAWESCGVSPIGLRPTRWRINPMRCNTCTLDIQIGYWEKLLMFKVLQSCGVCSV